MPAVSLGIVIPLGIRSYLPFLLGMSRTLGVIPISVLRYSILPLSQHLRAGLLKGTHPDSDAMRPGFFLAPSDLSSTQ
jgi:hypothetical protein